MKPLRNMIFGVLSLLLLGASVFLVGNSRASVESPRYAVVESAGPFEIRDYPEMVMAEASTSGPDAEGLFSKLFNYISGRNTSNQKIAMTSPVLISRGPSASSMRFLLPAESSPAPPVPEGDVRLLRVPAGRFAALRFPTPADRATGEKEAAAKLAAELARRGIQTAGPFQIAYYDPPWTPGFLRRNEILVPVVRGKNEPKRSGAGRNP